VSTDNRGAELVVAELQCSARVVSALYLDRDFRRAARPLVSADLFPGRFEGMLAVLLCELGDDVDDARVLLEIDRRELQRYAKTEGGVVSQGWILEQLMAGQYTADPLRELARLKELKALRNLRYGLIELEREIGAAQTNLGQASTRVSALLTSASAHAGVQVRRLGEALHAAFERAANATHGVATRALQTGFPELDANTGGILLGYSWVMGASTNWGKSTSLVALYLAGVAQGFRPLIVSGEDAEELYARRVLGRIAAVNPARLRDGKLEREAWPRLTEAVARFASAASLPFFLDCRGKPSEQVLRETRGAVAAEGIDLLLVDYLQVWRPEQRNDRRHEVADIASGFTDIIKSAAHGCAGVLFSQLTVEQGEEPNKESIRESKDVGHRAEAIVLGWTDKQKQRWFLLDKNKDGPCPVRVPVWWDPVSAAIVAYEPGHEPAHQEGFGFAAP